MYHHWRGGFGVPVQDQENMAIRLVHVPDDELFYADHERGEAEAVTAEERHVRAIVSRETSATEKMIPVLDMILGKEVHVPCPGCRAMLVWKTTGIT